MPLEAVDEAKTAPPEDLRIQIAPVVHDDEHGRVVREHVGCSRKHGRHPGNVRLDRGSPGAGHCGPDLSLTPVVQPEQLVRVAVLLVVVDEALDTAAR